MRASPRRLLLLTASVAVGVAALVAINSFTDNLRDSVRRQAQCSSAPTSRWRAASRCRRSPSGWSTRSAAGAKVSPAHQLLRDGLCAPHRRGPPGAGGGDRGPAIRSTARSAPIPRPPGPAAERPLAVADPALLARPRRAWGIRSRWAKPGSPSPAPSRAPPAMWGSARRSGRGSTSRRGMSQRTGLLGFGARAEYEAYLRCRGTSPRSRSPESADRRCAPSGFGSAPSRTTTSRSTSPCRTSPAISASWPSSRSCSAASAWRARWSSSSASAWTPIAVLRCLGATGGRVLAVYAARGRGDGARGQHRSARPPACSSQQALARRSCSDLLPVDVEPLGLAGARSALGVGIGLWVASGFALFPLLAVRRVPPLAALRRDVEPDCRGRAIPGGGSWRWRLRAAPSVLAAPAGRELAQRRRFAAGDRRSRCCVLWGASWALVRAARRWLPGGWPYLWRQGLSNLHRPSNQTVTVVLAIGFGAFLLGTLVLVQSNLLRQLR